MTNFINKKFWKNKRVFVTGHTGFKGSWLCLFLNLLGARVTGYSLEPKSTPNLYNLSNVKKSSLNSNIEVGDVLLKGKSQKANIDE